MKKIITVIVGIVVLLLFASCSHTSVPDVSQGSILCSTIDYENVIKSYKINMDSGERTEITIPGYSEISFYKEFDSCQCCFAVSDADGKTYYVQMEENSLYSTPLANTNYGEIFFYDGSPLFMLTDEATYEAQFFAFDKNKQALNVVYRTEELPAYYFVVDDCLVMLRNNVSINDTDDAFYDSFGEICLLRGGAEESIISGLSPMEYDAHSFLFFRQDNEGNDKAFLYNVSDDSFTEADVIVDPSSRDVFPADKPRTRLLNREAFIYCKESMRSDCLWLTTQNKKHKLVNFEKERLLYFTILNETGSFS